jgi:hypothetical protein
VSEEQVSTMEGITEWMRSQREPHDCICCDGPHVFARGLRQEDGHPVDWLWDAIRQVPEGARVRLSLTVLCEG